MNKYYFEKIVLYFLPDLFILLLDFIINMPYFHNAIIARVAVIVEK